MIAAGISVRYRQSIMVTVSYSASYSRNVFLIDGQERPQLTLESGVSYRFDQADSSNTNHPLQFSSNENPSECAVGGDTRQRWCLY